MNEKAYIQVYTGNGKGKTTAALGLALRSLCAGNRVFFGQFMKGQAYSELNAPAYFENLTMEQFGDPHFVKGKPSEEDVANAKAGFARMKEVLASGAYDVVIFDELNTALFFGLLPVEEVTALLETRPPHTEVVLTGRYAPKEILDIADLVTEMAEVKHYYNEGVQARAGIEN
jgi:cob(I)alamin adenosyltransferase